MIQQNVNSTILSHSQSVSFDIKMHIERASIQAILIAICCNIKMRTSEALRSIVQKKKEEKPKRSLKTSTMNKKKKETPNPAVQTVS